MNLISLVETARYLNELAILENRPDFSMDQIRAVQHGINNQIKHPLCTQVMNLACIFYNDQEDSEPQKSKSKRAKFATEQEIAEQGRLHFNRDARNTALAEGKKRFKGRCRIHSLTTYVIYTGTAHRCAKCNSSRYNIKKPKSIKEEMRDAA